MLVKIGPGCQGREASSEGLCPNSLSLIAGHVMEKSKSPRGIRTERIARLKTRKRKRRHSVGFVQMSREKGRRRRGCSRTRVLVVALIALLAAAVIARRVFAPMRAGRHHENAVSLEPLTPTGRAEGVPLNLEHMAVGTKRFRRERLRFDGIFCDGHPSHLRPRLTGLKVFRRPS